MNSLIKIFVLIITIIVFIIFFKNKNKNELMLDIKFWILFPWSICLFLYCFSGLKYIYNLDLYSFGYIILYWVAFFLGYSLIKKRNKKTENKVDYSKKLKLMPLFIVSLIGIIIYTSYVLSTNNIQIGVTRDINTNAISTVGLILSCASLVVWLYEFAYSLLNEKKVSFIGIASAFIYNIPGIMISGRDSLSIFLICTFVVYTFNKSRVNYKRGKIKNKKILILFVIFAIVFSIFLTKNRYGSQADAALKMFEWSSGVKFPEYLLFIYNNLGGIGKLILNLIFYYTSQFSKFSLMFKSYQGPYLYGFFELHYISRLLPESVQLNYMLVSQSIASITYNSGLPGLRVFWDTSIGYMIFDYGRIGALIAIFFYGIIIKLLSNWSSSYQSIIHIITHSILCAFVFITIEFSPLFDYFLIFPIFWLLLFALLYKKGGRRRI